MDNNNFNNDPNYGESDNNDYSAPQQDYSAPQQTYGQYAEGETQNSQTDSYNTYSQYNDQQYNDQQYSGQQYNNQQYNSQQYNGQQYNGQQYNSQQYNGQQYNGQQYNGQQYNAYNNGQYTNQYNTYGTIGGVPVDEKGQPLKNRFGMKLTFSILEIISCNLISLIMGILGCVFTSKANSAYKEGRWDEFKSSAKTATVVLWVGLGGIILSLFMWIIMIVAMVQEMEPYEDEFSSIMENNGDTDYDELYDQLMQDSEFSDLMDESGNSYNDDSYGDQYDIPDAAELSDWYTFAINGEVYSVPNFPDTFTAAGLTWEDCFYTDKIAEEDYELYYWEDPVSGESIGLVWIANIGEGPCSPEDGVAFQVNIENEGIYGGYKPNLVFGDGLTFDSSIEDIIACFGEPDDESHYSDSSSSSDTYYWYMDDDYCGIEVDFYDGQFYEIDIEYYGD